MRCNTNAPMVVHLRFQWLQGSSADFGIVVKNDEIVFLIRLCRQFITCHTATHSITRSIKYTAETNTVCKLQLIGKFN